MVMEESAGADGVFQVDVCIYSKEDGLRSVGDVGCRIFDIRTLQHTSRRPCEDDARAECRSGKHRLASQGTWFG